MVSGSGICKLDVEEEFIDIEEKGWSYVVDGVEGLEGRALDDGVELRDDI